MFKRPGELPRVSVLTSHEQISPALSACSASIMKGEAHMTDFKDLITIKNIVLYSKLMQEETDPDKCSEPLRLFENEIGKRLASAKSAEIAKTRIS